MRAVMLLCDHAAVENGKLYINGGGWSQARAGQPLNMGLAIKLDVPWNETNTRHPLRARLITEDGQQVRNAEGNAYEVTAQVEVGRPPGLRAGIDLDTSLAVNFQALELEPGGYRWELSVDDEVLAEASLQVVQVP